MWSGKQTAITQKPGSVVCSVPVAYHLGVVGGGGSMNEEVGVVVCVPVREENRNKKLASKFTLDTNDHMRTRKINKIIHIQIQ